MIIQLFLMICKCLEFVEIAKNTILFIIGVVILIVHQMSKNPSDFLTAVIGKPVIVKLNSAIEYRGTLNAGFDDVDRYLMKKRVP